MSESEVSQVRNLLGQIRAETTLLEARIQYAPEPLRILGQQIIDQQRRLIDPQFIEPIAREDREYPRAEDRLDISTRRSEWIVWARNQIGALQNLNNAMRYDLRDYAIIANNVFLQLCSLGEGWRDIRPLADNLRAYSNRDDVVYIAITVLESMEYIVRRDPQSYDVELTSLGRENCARGIEIPPSDIQRLSRSFTSRSFT